MKRTILLLASVLLVLSSCCSQHSVKGKPIIGISSGYSQSSDKASLGRSYTEAVIKGGGVPYILPLVSSEEVAKSILDGLDGLILSGGEDINPAYYGEDTLANGGVSVNGPRDTSDMFIIKEAMNRKMPILAICRGEQILNVALGGSLYQDIPSQIPNCLVHRQEESGTIGTMKIGIADGSYIKGIIGLDSLNVNSFHHQAVKDLAPGLKLVSTASDGVVEAYEGLPELNVIGTQFHPEIFTKAGDPTFVKFFKDLVSRAEAYRKTK